MTRFTDDLWRNTQPVYDAILAHPFIDELTDGSLSRERFVFYMKQDALYLQDFSRALALTSSRLPDLDAAQAFLGFAHGVFAVERQLHETYFRDFDVILDVERAPACFAYTQFLLAMATTATHEEAAAALLPCFWIYREVGNHIVAKARAAVAENPYAKWIQTYSGDDYDASVARAIEVVETLGAQASPEMRSAMQRAFEKSARLEWMFWDSAYRLEAWPPTPD
jgi:thiaminase/transcriptional activator TenA